MAVPEPDYYKHLAQQLSSHIGKILRIKRDGSVAADNPFVNGPGALPEIWSYGHRVPTGLFQDPQTQIVWEVESGPRGGDELNILKAGGNFGWAKASWGFDYTIPPAGLQPRCNSVPGSKDGGQVGPDLFGINASKAGTRPDFTYSAAMSSSLQTWNFISLNMFIADPGRYMPGTAMTSALVHDTETRRNIVGFLMKASPDK